MLIKKKAQSTRIVRYMAALAIPFLTVAHAQIVDNGTTTAVFNDASLGEVLTTPFIVENNTASTTEFILSVSTASGGVGALPTGWSVRFFDSSGARITATPSLTVGASFSGTIEITVADTGYSARHDSVGSGYADVNVDSDEDYTFYIASESVASGQQDFLLVGVDVGQNRDVVIVGSQTVYANAGSVVEFTQTLFAPETNNTDSPSISGLSISTSISGWSYSVLIDTVGDGVADTPLSLLAPDADVWLRDKYGVLYSKPLEGGNIRPEIGESVELSVRFFVPTNALNGSINYISVEPVGSFDTTPNKVINTLRVAESSLQLSHFAATIPAGGSIDSYNGLAYTSELGQVNSGTEVWWLVIAKNIGLQPVNHLRIVGDIPAFSAFDAEINVCSGDHDRTTQDGNCGSVALTQTVGDDECEYDGSSIYCDFQQEGTPPILSGGNLNPGETVSVWYRTLVD